MTPADQTAAEFAELVQQLRQHIATQTNALVALTTSVEHFRASVSTLTDAVNLLARQSVRSDDLVSTMHHTMAMMQQLLQALAPVTGTVTT